MVSADRRKRRVRGSRALHAPSFSLPARNIRRYRDYGSGVITVKALSDRGEIPLARPSHIPELFLLHRRGVHRLHFSGHIRPESDVERSLAPLSFYVVFRQKLFALLFPLFSGVKCSICMSACKNGEWGERKCSLSGIKILPHCLPPPS